MSAMTIDRDTTMAEGVDAMKAIVAERYGRPDVLELRDVEKPTIEDDQVLVRVHASSVNPVEWYGVTGPLFARGGGFRRPASPAVGADLAGRVEAVGSAVTSFAPGDEVFGTGSGAWAELAAARRVAPRAEAGGRVVRGCRRDSHRGDHRAAGAPRPREGRGRSEGARQRRVRWRRHLRGAAREVPGRRRDRGVQHGERRAGPLTRGRPRRGLHPRRTSREAAFVTTCCSTSPAAARSGRSGAS